MESKFDLVIIGAGAAGLMAAASAGARGLKVLLLEKNRKLGVKILMSGGTRCNITHNCPSREIVRAFGRQGNFLYSPLAALPPETVVEKIEAQGVATKVESTGKIFPVSNRAIDVRDALVAMAEEAGAEIRNQSPVESVTRQGDRFLVAVGGDRAEQIDAGSVLITTGGKSYPGCGTTGDGYVWAQSFGHTIERTVPALVPILSRCQWANELKGITIEHTGVEIWQKTADAAEAAATSGKKKAKKPKPLIRAKGSFLFTHFGFSGPTALDVSRAVALSDNARDLELQCDFLPEFKSTKLLNHLTQKRSQNGKQSVANLLNDLFPKRLAEGLLSASGVPLDSPNAELSNEGLERIVRQVKANRFEINGTLGFEKAEVTAGGVCLDEVDSSSMQSKLVDGLYFAGEVLDLDGPIGGFNFQSAFSTGWLAGQSVPQTMR
jgi:predicted Rossmann fold flavoprotein